MRLTLACPSSLLFLPLTAALIWIIPVGADRVRAALYAVAMLAIAAAVVSPWTIRNYIVFDEIVPVRTGHGLMTFISVVATGATVEPESLRAPVDPPWRAPSVGKAIYFANDFHERRDALEQSFRIAYTSKVGGTQYAALNEVQRDAWLLGETTRYIRDNPVLSIQLAAMTLKRWVTVDGDIGVWLCALAAMAALLAIQQRSAIAIMLGGWVAAYAAPFLLICSYFERYRAPIDPLLVILAVYGLATAFARFPARPQIAADCSLTAGRDTP